MHWMENHYGLVLLNWGTNIFQEGWYGRSSNHAYDELQYSLSLTQEKNDWSFYAGYTHLVFSKDNESDDEWSFGLAYDNLPYSIGTSVDGTYSMDAEGMFYEWSTYREFSISDKSGAVVSEF